MEKIEIDGVEYDHSIVEKFLKASGLEPGTFETLDDDEEFGWYKQLMASHLHTFSMGYTCGYMDASAECPDCDDCDIYEKVNEAGPPESHHSNWDR